MGIRTFCPGMRIRCIRASLSGIINDWRGGGMFGHVILGKWERKLDMVIWRITGILDDGCTDVEVSID